MKITTVGAGYVGLVSGICLSDLGHDVVCVDNNPDRIAALNRGDVPIYEPGLAELLQRNVAAGRLSFSCDLGASVQGSHAVFICVGTPSLPDEGGANLRFVFAVAQELSACIEPGTVVITKSTVPVGTNREVARLISQANPRLDFSVASNPEFLREGSAIRDFMYPDRVVAGVEDARGQGVVRDIYAPLSLRDVPVMITDIPSAELIKYSANAFLAMKIGFINEISALCEAVGADVQSVSKGIGLDSRIGSRFLQAGPGYGGSCFPKDTRALVRMGLDAGTPIEIVAAVERCNEEHKLRMVDKIESICGGDLSGKRVAVLGVTFKPETDDMREAPSLTILPELSRRGATIVITDPQGKKDGERYFPYVQWVHDAYEAAVGSDVVVILTEWVDFLHLDLAAISRSMRTPVMADLRNIYSADIASASGFSEYTSVGRKVRTCNENANLTLIKK